jgi:hypothetical protein
LAPTLSDPASRVEKSESRNNVSIKKKSIRASGIVCNNKAVLLQPSANIDYSAGNSSKAASMETSSSGHAPSSTSSSNKPEMGFNKTAMPRISNAMQEVRDWWTEQIAYDSGSEDGL